MSPFLKNLIKKKIIGEKNNGSIKSSQLVVFIISVASILYALIINPPYWIVYAISIVFIPLTILSFDYYLWLRVRKKKKKIKEENHLLVTKKKLIIKSYDNNR